MELRQEATAAVQTGAGFIVCVLVVTGIAGTVFKVIAPGGWIAQAFGHSAKAGFSLLLAIALFALAGAVYLARFWTTGML